MNVADTFAQLIEGGSAIGPKVLHLFPMMAVVKLALCAVALTLGDITDEAEPFLRLTLDGRLHHPARHSLDRYALVSGLAGIGGLTLGVVCGMTESTQE